MNVFFISPGRTATTSISMAFDNVNGYTSKHESKCKDLGDERIEYPENHFECDNRLTWFLPRLTEKYKERGVLVIVKRDYEKIAKSYNQRWYGIGIMKAYSQGILMRRVNDNNLDVCMDYVRNVYEHVEYFSKDWSRVVVLDIDFPEDGVKDVLQYVGKEEMYEQVLSSLKSVYANKNKGMLHRRYDAFKRNAKILCWDLCK